jgi:hypothetical protein
MKTKLFLKIFSKNNFTKLFLPKEFFDFWEQKQKSFSGSVVPAHEAESRTGEAIRCNLVD